MQDPEKNGVENSVAQNSVSQILIEAKQGDEQAALKLWNRYFQRLMAIAKKRIRGAPARAADEEDAVTSAFASLFRGMEQNRFAKLNDRDDLWQVLVMLTVRKAVNQRKKEQAQKRGSGAVRGESALGHEGSSYMAEGLAGFMADEETPAFTAEMEEQCQRLFDMLDENQRQIALWRLEGYTNQEIADDTGHTLSWVERKFRIIRQKWSQAL